MRLPTQLTSGFVVHLVLALALVGLFSARQSTPPPASSSKAVVWTPRVGDSGGGRGGDGAKASPAPLRRILRAEPQYTLPQVPAALASLELPGAMVRLSAAEADGAGTHDGKGRGEGLEGPGSGARAGLGAGSGDGPFVDGAPGVTSPQVLFESKPQYTAAAMAARVQGPVLLEATVLADGTVGEVRVVRSLDLSFGLDQNAIEAVRRWRFRPGSRLGQPVAVRVLIELSFTLR